MSISIPQKQCNGLVNVPSAVGGTINQIHAVMARLSDSVDAAENAFFPALRQCSTQSIQSPPDQCAESALHQELILILGAAERILSSIDNLSNRSTL